MSSSRCKPCPFCGAEPTVKTYPQERYGLRGCVEVSCENALCLMNSVVAEENSIEHAAAHWNRRAVQSEIAATMFIVMIRNGKRHAVYAAYAAGEAAASALVLGKNEGWEVERVVPKESAGVFRLYDSAWEYVE